LIEAEEMKISEKINKVKTLLDELKVILGLVFRTRCSSTKNETARVVVL
jgi:hypothetical protein